MVIWFDVELKKLDIHNKHKSKNKHKSTISTISTFTKKGEMNWSWGRGKGLSSHDMKFVHFGNIMNVLYTCLTFYRPKILIMIMFSPKAPWVKFDFGYFWLAFGYSFWTAVNLDDMIGVPCDELKNAAKTCGFLYWGYCIPNPTITIHVSGDQVRGEDGKKWRRRLEI